LAELDVQQYRSSFPYWLYMGCVGCSISRCNI